MNLRRLCRNPFGLYCLRHVIAPAAVTAVALVVVWLGCRTPEPEPAVELWPVAGLPKHVYHTGRAGFTAEVSFQHPLTPTADPCVYLYHPGRPVSVCPASYEIRFARPPAQFQPSPVVVRGRVEVIRADAVRRVSGVPGRLVLCGCVLAPP